MVIVQKVKVNVIKGQNAKKWSFNLYFLNNMTTLSVKYKVHVNMNILKYMKYAIEITKIFLTVQIN